MNKVEYTCNNTATCINVGKHRVCTYSDGSRCSAYEKMSKELTIQHCKEVMSKALLIGSDNAWDGRRKLFLFDVWENEYQVVHGLKVIDSGQAVEELLSVYNDL